MLLGGAGQDSRIPGRGKKKEEDEREKIHAVSQNFTRLRNFKKF